MLTAMRMKHTKEYTEEYKNFCPIFLTYSYKSTYGLITDGPLHKYGIKYTLQTQLSFS